jgi:signal peptidase II
LTSKKLLALFMPAAIVVAIDQWTKYIIRTTPELHRMDIIEGWLSFYYTQNDGMAMGIDIFSTPVISAISIIATIGILSYLLYTIDKAPIGYLIFMGLVIGGALGNITDRLTMGYIEGYGGLLDGHVVDFIFFNLELFDRTVFPYIFNVADVAISTSIISLLVFNKKLMPHEEVEEETNIPEEATVSSDVSEDSSEKE